MFDGKVAPDLDGLDLQHTRSVRQHLKEVLASKPFAGSKRAQEFLQLVVEHALKGEFDSLRERALGSEMFGRPIGYDTGNDPVVRVKAGEVRRKLAQYYGEAERKATVRFELPSGSYVPKFCYEPLQTAEKLQTDPVLPSLPPQPADQIRIDLEDRAEARSVKPSGRASRDWRHLPGLAAAMAFALGLTAIFGSMGFKSWHESLTALPEMRSIAVLPLKNLSGDPGQDYFADGMTEALINDLGQVSAQRVTSLTSVMSYKGTRKALPEIAQELTVDGVVEGTVQRDGNQLQVSAQLIDARTDRPVWARTYVRTVTSVLALQGELAEAIADEVRMNEAPQGQARLTSVRSANPEAEDQYLQGMVRFNMGEFESAAEFFQKAIDADPGLAQAHAGLGASYGVMGEHGRMAYSEAFLKQKSEATKAIELDGSSPAGHAELADVAIDLNWDWAAAANEFHRALELNPSSAPTHGRYAIYLARNGKFPEAIAEIQEGMKLDPVSGRSYKQAASIYYFSGQFDKALALDENSFHLGRVYVEKGMYAQSILNFLRADDTPHNWGHLGNAYARSGQVDSARTYISRLKANVRSNGVGRYEIALIYAGLGDKNEAFKWLEESYRAHDVGLTYLKIDPCLAPLRSDARFNSLLGRVGLMQ
jgi:TolB-like protein/Tfp pilus assembly protein PilF